MTKLTRRSVVVLAVTAPVATQVVTAWPNGRRAWGLALKQYNAARKRHEAYLARVLDPLLCSEESHSPCNASRVGDLEAESDALCSARHDALAVLMDLPAPCLASLCTKFRLAYEEVLQFEDGNGFLQSLLADLDRLSGPGPA